MIDVWRTVSYKCNYFRDFMLVSQLRKETHLHTRERMQFSITHTHTSSTCHHPQLISFIPSVRIARDMSTFPNKVLTKDSDIPTITRLNRKKRVRKTCNVLGDITNNHLSSAECFPGKVDFSGQLYYCFLIYCFL